MGSLLLNLIRRMIFRDFAWLIIAGFVLAIPLSYYMLSEWLQNFTYHTSIDVGVYLLSLMILVIIVTLTIGFQAVRASLANPVTSLRSE